MSLRKVSLFVVAGLLGVETLAVRQAHAALSNFYFSFDDTVPTSGLGVPGTVTGEIEGLASTGTSAASDVIILTAPAALPNNVGPLPLDLGTSGFTFNINSFTVSNGQIVAADFDASNGGFVGHLVLDGPVSGNNYLTLNSGGSASENFGGFAGATYTAVPEPASLVVIGVPAAIALLRRRRSIVSNAI